MFSEQRKLAFVQPLELGLRIRQSKPEPRSANQVSNKTSRPVCARTRTGGARAAALSIGCVQGNHKVQGSE